MVNENAAKDFDKFVILCFESDLQSQVNHNNFCGEIILGNE